MKPLDHIGPAYPALGTAVLKYRRLAKHGLSALSAELRRAYGDTVLLGVRQLQRRELQRELPSHNVNCASRTNYNTGEEILAAIRRQHRAALGG